MGSDIALQSNSGRFVVLQGQKYSKKYRKKKEKSRITSSIFEEVYFENQSIAGHHISPVHYFEEHALFLLYCIV